MLLVSDANIFIDLEVSGLTRQLFLLPHEIVVPDNFEVDSPRAHGLRLDGGRKTISREIPRRWGGVLPAKPLRKVPRTSWRPGFLAEFARFVSRQLSCVVGSCSPHSESRFAVRLD